MLQIVTLLGDDGENGAHLGTTKTAMSTARVESCLNVDSFMTCSFCARARAEIAMVWEWSGKLESIRRKKNMTNHVLSEIREQSRIPTALLYTV